MLKNKLLIVALISAFCGMELIAQNNTNSPYSRYGYGILDDNSFGMGRAMGGIGYGLRSSRQINVKNPASYAEMDSLTFLFDFGVNLQNVWMKEAPTGAKESQINGNLEYIAMQFPLGKNVAASVGLLPFSYVGYSYGGTIANGAVSRLGEGGINQVYGGLSVNVYRGFSLGANISYLFGNIVHDNYIIPSAENSSSSVSEYKLHVSDFHFDFGAQYTQKLNEKDKFTIGAVYSPRKTLLGHEYSSRQVYDDSSSVPQQEGADTLTLKGRYDIASTYGLGFTFSRNNLFTVGADVTFQDWKDARFAGRTDVLNNRLKISVGGEYIPDYLSRSYHKRMRYRAGAFYNQSYLRINDAANGTTANMREAGVSCGLGLPIRSDKSVVNFALEYVNRNTTPQTLITENYLRISVSLTFNEFWFFKRQFE
ncbi:MAG: hypothetical protein J1E02_01420 [Coprobacter sp.]|nr:hypothetical protein [Coprobacter sp.]